MVSRRAKRPSKQSGGSGTSGRGSPSQGMPGLLPSNYPQRCPTCGSAVTTNDLARQSAPSANLHIGAFPDNSVVCHAYRRADGEYVVNGTRASDVAAVIREFERSLPVGSSQGSGIRGAPVARSEKPTRQHPRSGTIVNIHGGQVQMTTGDNSPQSINAGLAADHLVLVIRGITEMLGVLQLEAAQATALEKAQRSAVQDITSEAPSGKGVKRFYDSVLRCVKQGGSAALVAAVTAAANGLLHDAEEFVRALAR